MAYAALVSLSQILEQFTDGDRLQIKSLLEKLSLLQSFLEDYAHSTAETNDPLEGRIREASYQTADIVELYISDEIHLQHKFGFQYMHRTKLKKRYYEDLRRIIQEIDIIMEEALEIKKRCRVQEFAPSGSVGATSSKQTLSSGNTVVGFDEDLMKLKDRLCGETNKLQIISIVGMGGIGKTTLARTTFDDSLVVYHFDIRAWVTVSQEYRMRDILLGLLHSLDATNTSFSDELLAEHVYKCLKGRRYLIVMDDMWSTRAWDDMRRILPDDNNGSRIIITSRLSEVAIYADSSSPLHQMQLLNGDQSWSLLQEKVFAQEGCPVELEGIGKTIVEKCRGLPLAIVLVAGLLSKVDKTLYQWEKFELNVSSTLATGDDHLFKILSLSYNNLPHHLRACFLYMGGFPEDSQIPIAKLTKLWTAEGFLKPVRSKSLEEVAEQYVEDLAKANLISPARKHSNGKSKFCSIHDLLRDFCIWKAHDENFLHVERHGGTSQEGVEDNRRLCTFIDHIIPTTKASGLLLRSVLFSKYEHYSMPCGSNYRLLRVLDGPKIHLQLFPTEVTELFHLRYLVFSHFSKFSTPFEIPTSIRKLQNLQTLIITSDYRKYPRLYKLGRKISLPSEIWEMPNLRHLILHNYCHLPVPFHWLPVGKPYVLQNLQTLSRVTNFSFTKKIIEMIPNLKKLRVVYFRDVVKPKMVWSTCHLSNLPLLHQLESLNLCFPFKSLSEHSLRSDFTQNFALPLKLKKLTLTGSCLSWQDLSIVGRLPNLEILKLRDASVVGSEWKPTEGEFHQLKFLLMENLDIKYWRAEYTHFPSLDHLIVKNCWQLEEIPSEIGEIPTLRSIEVVNVSESAKNSAIQIQEEQESLGNDSLRVSVSYMRSTVW